MILGGEHLVDYEEISGLTKCKEKSKFRGVQRGRGVVGGEVVTRHIDLGLLPLEILASLSRRPVSISWSWVGEAIYPEERSFARANDEYWG